MFHDATVADAMHAGVTTCPAGATIAEIAEAMAQARIHCVIVVDGDGRRPWAVVSDLDLMGALVAGGAPPAASLAATEVATVMPATPLREAARIMAEDETHHLVVLDPCTAHPVGVISTLDIARAAA